MEGRPTSFGPESRSDEPDRAARCGQRVECPVRIGLTSLPDDRWFVLRGEISLTSRFGMWHPEQSSGGFFQRMANGTGATFSGGMRHFKRKILRGFCFAGCTCGSWHVMQLSLLFRFLVALTQRHGEIMLEKITLW